MAISCTWTRLAFVWRYGWWHWWTIIEWCWRLWVGFLEIKCSMHWWYCWCGWRCLTDGISTIRVVSTAGRVGSWGWIYRIRCPPLSMCTVIHTLAPSTTPHNSIALTEWVWADRAGVRSKMVDASMIWWRVSLWPNWGYFCISSGYFCPIVPLLHSRIFPALLGPV